LRRYSPLNPKAWISRDKGKVLIESFRKRERGTNTELAWFTVMDYNGI